MLKLAPPAPQLLTLSGVQYAQKTYPVIYVFFSGNHYTMLIAMAPTGATTGFEIREFCPACDGAPESLEHTLLQCDASGQQTVWALTRQLWEK